MDTYFGKPMRRLENRRFLTGAAQNTADLDLPDQVHAVVLRAPHAHAQIVGIDTEAARNVPGGLHERRLPCLICRSRPSGCGERWRRAGSADRNRRPATMIA
jgi:hypothetical protein